MPCVCMGEVLTPHNQVTLVQVRADLCSGGHTLKAKEGSAKKKEGWAWGNIPQTKLTSTSQLEFPGEIDWMMIDTFL